MLTSVTAAALCVDLVSHGIVGREKSTPRTGSDNFHKSGVTKWSGLSEPPCIRGWERANIDERRYRVLLRIVKHVGVRSGAKAVSCTSVSLM